MAMFQRSYQDIIRKMMKEKKKKEGDLYNINTPYFSTYLFDISDEKISPVANRTLFKKTFAKKYKYSLSVFDNTDQVNVQENKYRELVGKNGWVAAHADLPSITDDFLTGYYFSKAFIKDKKGRPIIYYGAAKANLLNGIVYEFSKHISSLVVCCIDKRNKHNNNKYMMGVTGSSDITDNNVIRSLHNKINNRYDTAGTFICDIYPANIKVLYNALILAMMNIDTKGTSIIRIPDPHIWHDTCQTLLLNFFAYVISCWHNVKIFKTPWGMKTRYYLLLNKPKEQFTYIHYNAMLKYTDFLSTNNVNLLQQQFFDNLSCLDVLKKTRTELLNFSPFITIEEANAQWLDQMMGIENDNNEGEANVSNNNTNTDDTNNNTNTDDDKEINNVGNDDENKETTPIDKAIISTIVGNDN